MRRRIRYTLSLTLIVCGCAAPDIRVAKPTNDIVAPSCEGMQGDLTVVTYDGSIAPGAKKRATPRLPEVARGIATTPFDVMCVQEIYLESAKEAVARGLPDDVQSFWVNTTGRGISASGACSASQVAGVRTCVEQKCANTSPEETTMCAIRKCKSALVGMYLFDQTCLECLASSTGRDLDGIEDLCVRGNGVMRSYDGQNGLMLLSRHPVRDREVVHLPSSVANRVGLLATVDLPTGQSVRVACTQLSTPSVVGPMHDEFSSWAEEQQTQARIVLDAVERSENGMPVVVLGEFGFGLSAGETVRTISPEAWYTFQKYGYWSPAMHVRPPVCTQCRGNALRGSEDPSFLTSHVFLKLGDARRVTPVCADTVATEPRRMRGYSDGQYHVTPPSDHYGLRMRLILQE